ncbi:hypothetical protein PVK06_024603 [Gossypium arboreum]|uniref:Uncharacterized protein n=1 Tax=Gossypium arboreum TaxID=29729 RepID=A0ABR0PEJ0_GOSAR|nr:hypothetical protein PVK06_024603 [Gossypium arboreum]
MSCKRNDGILFLIGAGKGTSNTVLEGENEDVNEEEDADLVTTEPEPCESKNEASDNASNLNLQFITYEPSPYLMNIDLSIEGDSEFSQLPHSALGHGASQNHLRPDSNMIADIILLIVKASPLVEISVLIANIHSQYHYSPTYYKVLDRDAFLHCKPMVQIDGTWLYERYEQCLLLSVAQDDNQKILAIAFAITSGEMAMNKISF